jgi:hypothetical protein
MQAKHPEEYAHHIQRVTERRLRGDKSHHRRQKASGSNKEIDSSSSSSSSSESSDDERGLLFDLIGYNMMNEF